MELTVSTSAIITCAGLNYRVVGMGSKLVGCGSAIPTLSVSNDDLSNIVETSDEWIAARTGIRNRRVLSGNYIFYSFN